MAERVRIVEVGPRDGLQNEAVAVSVETRIAFIEQAHRGGAHIHRGRKLRLAQMGAANGGHGERSESRIAADSGVSFPVLVPNEKGLDAALEAGAREIAIFAAASETFSQKNINCSIAESFERFAPVVERALSAGIRVRGLCVLRSGLPL